MMTFPPVWKTTWEVVATRSSSSIRWMRSSSLGGILHSEEPYTGSTDIAAKGRISSWHFLDNQFFPLPAENAEIFPWIFLLILLVCRHGRNVRISSKKKGKKSWNFITQHLTIQLPSNSTLNSKSWNFTGSPPVDIASASATRSPQPGPIPDESKANPYHENKELALTSTSPAGLEWCLSLKQPLWD